MAAALPAVVWLSRRSARQAAEVGAELAARREAIALEAKASPAAATRDPRPAAVRDRQPLRAEFHIYGPDGRVTAAPLARCPVRGTWQTTGGSGLGVAVIVALVLIGSGALTAIMHALAVLLIAAVAAVPVTAVSIIALAAQRTRSDRPGWPDGPAWVSREPPGTRPRLEVPHKPAIEPPRQLGAPEVHHHLHLHGLTPEQIAAILTQPGGWTPP